MTKKKKYLLLTAVILMIIAAGVKLFIPSIPEMFKMNKQLQEQGYYMAEFEFRMLGIAYYLDRGNYITAFSKLKELNNQMKTKEGLIKVPEFKDKKEEMDFYLSRQNPDTGAFMDKSYPFCTYASPTANILNHLDALARETGQPLKLKYPLKFLDEVNTPEKLNNYLNEVSAVGWIGNRFPQTSFHFARCLLSLFYEDPVIEKYNLYNVSPEWKNAMLQWFYKNQDPETGLWGPRSKSGKLARNDTSNTACIIKAFVDGKGNDIRGDFPLKYKDKIAQSFLAQSFDRIPENNDYDKWHEWNLNTSKSIRTLTRYLWKGLSADTKAKVKEKIEYYIRIKFDKFYIKEEGSFSYYPGAEHATIEGSGVIGDLNNYGYSSKDNQVRLWGNPELKCDVSINTHEITVSELKVILNLKGINSIRIYPVNPKDENYTVNVLGVFYPQKTSVLDVMDLIPEMKTWISSTSQSMGNWTSREEIIHSLSEIKIKPVTVFKGERPLEDLNNALKKNKKLILIGFDILQIPVYKITCNLK